METFSRWGGGVIPLKSIWLSKWFYLPTCAHEMTRDRCFDRKCFGEKKVALGQLVPEARRLPEGISAARSPFFFLLCLGIQTTYFSNFKQVYTAGYATSLVSLISAVFVFFHCTRNYIHMNLFFSFILRASAVFIKDEILFSNQDLDHCFMSTTSCKSAVAFFQFSILANYFWLLVEGMYLQTLLALTFVFQKKYFWWYVLIGWGVPSTIITAWILTRNFYDDRGCWDDTDVAFVWWIIKAPITLSLLVNFMIFVNVIRILVQKLRSPAVAGNDSGHFKRLAKSTLLLIPLFGMHYMVFAFLPENTGAEARLFIELGLGSFQGFVVAFLYCFLNGEVSDLETRTSRRKIKKWMQNRPFGFRSRSFCSPSMSRGLCPTLVRFRHLNANATLALVQSYFNVPPPLPHTHFSHKHATLARVDF
uniref:Growth hormone releasing hormone receptor b n=1 Tax=Hippocampus comes TaxID=109280 RepID=A0A3Q2XJY8_HIPCM